MALSIEEVRQFLYREARFLDDKEWDSWLQCYAPDAEFWMPAWDVGTACGSGAGAGVTAGAWEAAGKPTIAVNLGPAPTQRRRRQ